MKRIYLTDIEKVHKIMHDDSVYGKDIKLLNETIGKNPLHTNLYEVVIKIIVIDLTHSTNLRMMRKHFDIYDLANNIMNIPNIDKRLEQGDLSLVEDMANINGKRIISFASKYCTLHNQIVYNKDDYIKYDSLVRDFIPEYFPSISKTKIHNSYAYYHQIMDELIENNNLSNVPNIRNKVDHYIWYTSRNK